MLSYELKKRRKNVYNEFEFTMLLKTLANERKNLYKKKKNVFYAILIPQVDGKRNLCFVAI